MRSLHCRPSRVDTDASFIHAY